MTQNEFTDSPATRTSVPLLVGLYSPTGAGKTYSALRLGTGIRRVTGGDIFGIDTESNRMLHYAPLPGEKPDPSKGRFDFRHVPFGPPFEPARYLRAVEHCVKKGAKVVIVDSMTHEHTGVGGVLEMHDKECERLMREWDVKRGKVQIPAWARPKQERMRFIASLLQFDCNFIFCWRAKEKIKIETGKDPESMGWQPEGGMEFPYEMTLMALFRPGAGGVPEWHAVKRGEEMTIKLPSQFTWLRSMKGPMSEEMGQRMAEWAAGGSTAPTGPVFSARLDWPGKAQWGGKPLAAADSEALNLYGAHVEMALKDATGKAADKMKAALGDVRAELKERE